MTRRASIVVFPVLAVFTVLVALTPGGGPAARAEDGPGPAGRAPTPPSITYPASRTSDTWIEGPGGTRVAVGKGVTWKGVTVYLSLLYDLVGVDAKRGKTLYVENVGAFWNGLGFREVTTRDGTKTWAVALRPGPRARAGKDRRQYHDLRTGRKLDVPGGETRPAGEPLVPRAVWSGKRSRVAKPFHVVVSSAATWKTLTSRLFGKGVPDSIGPVDFTKEVVLVVSRGDGWNCNGIGLAAAFEDEHRILVRTARQSFQTIGGAERGRPYGLFVLPRRAGKAYVVERNRQNLIGGPPLWTEAWRLAKLGDPARELRHVPPATDVPHEGWAR